MQTVWILLNKAVFAQAQLVQSSQEQGVVFVDLPFDISAEFTPVIAKAANEHLTRLISGLPPEAPEFDAIVHQCEEMKTLVARARIVALRDVPVLLEGETGTGKELFARAIHACSNRKENLFIPVNCGAIPKNLFEAEFFGHVKGAFTGADKEKAGYFEMANNGTLFLDELGELDVDSQVKILRVLNDGKVRRVGDTVERKVNVRIISATNRNLITEVAAGRFRSDLFYRLAVAILKLPPIRERQGDLGLLIDSILNEVNKEMDSEGNYVSKTFSSKARNLMLRHRWLGNARELKNTITRICVWCPEKNIGEVDVQNALLPINTTENDELLNRPLGEDFKLQNILDQISSSYIKRALKETGGNKSKAAKLLGFESHQTLSNRMKNIDL
jgi:transcriptional regulator with PAS, ATPase and Fis domain